jgi:hypothetical protein
MIASFGNLTLMTRVEFPKLAIIHYPADRPTPAPQHCGHDHPGHDHPAMATPATAHPGTPTHTINTSQFGPYQLALSGIV